MLRAAASPTSSPKCAAQWARSSHCKSLVFSKQCWIKETCSPRCSSRIPWSGCLTAAQGITLHSDGFVMWSQVTGPLRASCS